MQTPPPMSNFIPAASEVDSSVWRAIAGAAVKIPSVNSYVYYFPQGHLEQAAPSSSPAVDDDVTNYNFTLLRPWIPCHVLSVRFLSQSSSDQAFVKILLQPLPPLGPRPPRYDLPGVGDDDDDDDDIVSFAKILTRSDANNGGGFSVPRFCADMILPQLDFAADPPVQNLVLRDTHNIAWEFRHIYRGTPRRHLLTTGWSKFVNAKRLVAGDSVVFIKRKSTSELFVGVRRAQRFVGGRDGGRERREALAAIENAVRKMPFEVVYYPKVGVPDFVVDAEKAKEGLRMSWSGGMRVRMAVETDDSSRLTWIQGVVAAVITPSSGMWIGSPWRMLQVSWDDPESSQNLNRVSPWQVEYIPLAPLVDPDYQASKRFKALQDSGMLPPETTSYSLPTTEFTRSTAGPLNSAVFNYSPFLAGIQGARRDHASTSGLSIINADMHRRAANELPKNEPRTVSTVLSIGSSYSDIRSPASQSSVHLGGAADLAGQPGGGSSFQLFGKTIQMSRPARGGSSHNAGCTDGGRKRNVHRD